MPFPGDEDWLPDTDDEAHNDAFRQATGDRPTADQRMVDEWRRKHAALEFVPAPYKTVTRKSKFEQEDRVGLQTWRAGPGILPRPRSARRHGVPCPGHSAGDGGLLAVPLLLDELIAKPPPVPRAQPNASRLMFTLAGVAVVCATVVAAAERSTSNGTQPAHSSLRQQIRA